MAGLENCIALTAAAPSLPAEVVAALTGSKSVSTLFLIIVEEKIGADTARIGVLYYCLKNAGSDWTKLNLLSIPGLS